MAIESKEYKYHGFCLICELFNSKIDENGTCISCINNSKNKGVVSEGIDIVDNREPKHFEDDGAYAD